jgi:hypothetical protein
LRWLGEVGVLVWGDGMGWGERQRERCEEQAALEAGTGTEIVVDCNRNCKGQQEKEYFWENKIFGI